MTVIKLNSKPSVFEIIYTNIVTEKHVHTHTHYLTNQQFGEMPKRNPYFFKSYICHFTICWIVSMNVRRDKFS